jgi:hypothetical protein
LQLIYILLPLLCVAAMPSPQNQGRFAERLVYGIALYAFLLYMIGIGLGSLGVLSRGAYVSAFSLLSAILLVLSWRNRTWTNAPIRSRWLQTRRGWVALVLLLLSACAFATQVGYDSLVGTRHPDGLWYHLPRVLFWLQQGNFEAWPTPVWAQIGLPLGADIILGHKLLLCGNWAGTGYITGVFSIGAAACVYLVALQFRLQRWQAMMAAILFFSFPAIGMRIWTVNSDIVAAFPVMAAYVALRRMKEIGSGVAVFVVLNGLAIACKPTVAPHVVLLGAVGIWQSRDRLLSLKSVILPSAAAAIAVGVIFFSYLPVYKAFHDFQGGEGGRSHKVASVQEFAGAVALSATHWLLEPLGYLHKGDGRGVMEISVPIYEVLGAALEDAPESWTPSPNQDVGRSGLASLWFFPVLLAGFSPPVRHRVAWLFFLGFIPLSGMVHFRPWNSRYTIILLGGFSLMWAGSRLLRHGSRRWLLASLVGLNLLALVGVSWIVIYKDMAIHAQPGGKYAPMEDGDRDLIQETLGDAPLLVIAQESFDALLVGPDVAFSLKYLVCPEENDWKNELQRAAAESGWLAVYHGGADSLVPGPTWFRPGGKVCPSVSLPLLKDSLVAAGWVLYKNNNLADLWVRSTDLVSGER